MEYVHLSKSFNVIFHMTGTKKSIIWFFAEFIKTFVQDIVWDAGSLMMYVKHIFPGWMLATLSFADKEWICCIACGYHYGRDCCIWYLSGYKPVLINESLCWLTRVGGAWQSQNGFLWMPEEVLPGIVHVIFQRNG